MFSRAARKGARCTLGTSEGKTLEWPRNQQCRRSAPILTASSILRSLPRSMIWCPRLPTFTLTREPFFRVADAFDCAKRLHLAAKSPNLKLTRYREAQTPSLPFRLGEVRGRV